MEKEYSNDMRGTLWLVDESDQKEKSPIAKGKITVSGVELMVSMWPKRKVDKAGSKAYGKTYMSLSIEYPKGATKFLAGVRPADVTVTSAVSDQTNASDSIDSADADDIPF